MEGKGEAVSRGREDKSCRYFRSSRGVADFDDLQREGAEGREVLLMLHQAGLYNFGVGDFIGQLVG